MKHLSKDARNFVDTVAKYVMGDGASRSENLKVKTLLSRVSNEDKKANQAKVETSVALTTAEKEQIGGFIERLVGHPVTLENSIVPDIIGGMRITIGDWILDTSLARQLDDLTSTLI